GAGAERRFEVDGRGLADGGGLAAADAGSSELGGAGSGGAEAREGGREVAKRAAEGRTGREFLAGARGRERPARRAVRAEPGGVAQVDRALRGAPGALRGLEKHLCALRQRAGTSERRRTGNAVRAHVHTLRDTHHRRQFAAGQRPSRAGARNSSGPVGEEAAGEKDLQLRTGQPLSGTRVRRGTQSTLS